LWFYALFLFPVSLIIIVAIIIIIININQRNCTRIGFPSQQNIMMMLSLTTLSSCMIKPFDWIFYIDYENREFRETGFSYSETGVSIDSPAHVFRYSITTKDKYSDWNYSSLPWIFHKQVRVVLPYYYESPCDADVLAGCVSASSNDDVLFVDLDPVSFESFTTFSSGNNNGNQSRLVLFYETSTFMDKLFFVENATSAKTTTSNNMTWFSSNKYLRLNQRLVASTVPSIPIFAKKAGAVCQAMLI
jgi:hypothetical protein